MMMLAYEKYQLSQVTVRTTHKIKERNFLENSYERLIKNIQIHKHFAWGKYL